MLSIKDINLYNKRVLIRSDLNVPIKNGNILSDIKIKLSIPTIEYAIKSGAYVIILTHLGNPNGININELSLEPIRYYLENYLKINVKLIKNYLNGINVNKNEILLLENARFNIGEMDNNINLSKKYANLCDIFVMDAFASSHRINSSTYGISKYVNLSCSGLLLSKEYKILSKFISNAEKPIISIVGGAKIFNKLNALKKLSKISYKVFVGGGIANTLIYSNNYNIGKSLFEKELINESIKLLKNNNIILPEDVRVTNNFSKNSLSKIKNINEINNDDIILDLGDKSINNIIKYIKKSKTLFWIGPVGMFEYKNFSIGTKTILNEISNSNIYSILGGGDTIFSLSKFNYLDKVSYFSTGGGALLKFIENKTFPIFKVLKK